MYTIFIFLLGGVAGYLLHTAVGAKLLTSVKNELVAMEVRLKAHISSVK
jgi:hypothetical protein